MERDALIEQVPPVFKFLIKKKRAFGQVIFNVTAIHMKHYIEFKFVKLVLISLTFTSYFPTDVNLTSLSEKTRRANHVLMSIQRQPFLLNYFKTLNRGPTKT